MIVPNTPAQASQMGLRWFFTGQPCKNGHIAKRYLCRDNPCKECVKARAARVKTPAEDVRLMISARGKRAYQKKKLADPGYGVRKTDLWRMRHPGLRARNQREFYCKNAEKLRPKYAAATRARQARLQNAMPDWADKEKIKEIYLEAAKKSAETGIKHHVDHIIPLRGKNVCGLHVHTNLRVITAIENLQKGARYGI
jgi:hypothetical protein